MKLASARAPLALLLEVLWSFAAVALLVRLFGQQEGPAPSMVAVAAAVLGSFFLAQLIRPSSEDDAGDPTLGVVLSVIAVAAIVTIAYAAAEPDFTWPLDLAEDPVAPFEANSHVIAATVALAALWIWGVRRGSAPAEDFSYVLGSASAGLVIVVIAAAVDPPVQGGGAWDVLAFAYGIIAVATLAVFRALPDAPAPGFAGRWTIVLVALASAAIVVALLAGTVGAAASDALAPLGAPLEVMGAALRDYVLGPIFAVVALPFRLLFAFLEWLAGGSGERELQPQDPPRPPEREEPDGDEPLWLRILIGIATGAGGIAVVAIALLVLWRAFQRMLMRVTVEDRDRREDVEAASSLGADLGAILGALGRRIRRPGRATTSVPIRRLYFDLMDRAGARGVERAPSQTPLQLAPMLDAAFASDVPSAITTAFIESRYGERTIDETAVRRLRERFERECFTGQP